MDQGRKDRALSRAVKKRIERGVLHVEATFNNTKASAITAIAVTLAPMNRFMNSTPLRNRSDRARTAWSQLATTLADDCAPK